MCDELNLVPAVPHISPEEFLDTYGRNRMQAPLGLIPGSAASPAVNFTSEDMQTGLFWINGALHYTRQGKDQGELGRGGGYRRGDAGMSRSILVGDTPVLLSEGLPTRLSVDICNEGSFNCWVGYANTVEPGSSVSANGGMLLRRGGSTGHWDQAGGYTGDIWAVTESGDLTIVSVNETFES